MSEKCEQCSIEKDFFVAQMAKVKYWQQNTIESGQFIETEYMDYAHALSLSKSVHGEVMLQEVSNDEINENMQKLREASNPNQF
jgi:hypothetical protein